MELKKDKKNKLIKYKSFIIIGLFILVCGGIIVTAELIGESLIPYQNKWLSSYETLKFNTTDGDIDFGQYAKTDGGYLIRTKPKNESQFEYVNLSYDVSKLKEVKIIGKAYYDEFLTADGANALYAEIATELPSGGVLRLPSDSKIYWDTASIKDYPQPERIELVSVLPLTEPIDDELRHNSIAYDATSNSGLKYSVSSYSWSHNASGDNRLLVVGDSHRSPTSATPVDITVSSITFDGVSLTSARTDSAHGPTSYSRTSIYYLIAPNTGVKTVVVNLSSSASQALGGVVSYTGASQTGQPDAVNGVTIDYGTVVGISTIVTTVADNSWVFSASFTEYSSPSSGNTLRWYSSGIGGGSDTGGPKTPAGGVNMSWNWSSYTGSYALSAVSFSPAVTADNEYPIFTNYWDNNGSLVGSGTAKFNATIISTNSSAGINFAGTNYSATNISSVFNTSFTATTGTYSYYWYAYGNGTSHNFNKSANFSYSVNASADAEYPLFSNYKTSINNSEYPFIPQFNVTIQSTNGTGGVEVNQINNTLSNKSNEFYADISNLGVGAYPYYFWAYGNGTNHKYNISTTQSYTIKQNTSLVLGISGTSPLTYGQTSDVAGSDCPAQLSCSLDKANIIYGVGTHFFNYSTAGNTNYSKSSINMSIIVNQNSSLVNLFLNGSKANTKVQEGTKIWLNGTLLTGEGNQTLYINGTIINSSANGVKNYYNFTAIGYHNITINHPTTQNFTTSYETWWINVTEVTADLINPNITLISPEDSSTNGSSTMNFTANITDDTSLANATLYIYNETGLYNETTTELSGTKKILGIVVYLFDGIYTWFMEARDAANNLFTSENRTLTIDTTSTYALDITSPTTAIPNVTTSGTNISVYFNFTQNSSYLTSGVTINNVTIGGVQADIITTSSCTGTLDCTVYEEEASCTNCSECSWGGGGSGEWNGFYSAWSTNDLGVMKYVLGMMDADNDGVKNDIMMGMYTTHRLAIYNSDGSEICKSAANIDDNSYYSYDEYSCGDLDNDGFDNDCVVGFGYAVNTAGFAIVNESCGVAFKFDPGYAGCKNTYATAVTDANGDGDDDIIWTCDNLVMMWEQVTPGVFENIWNVTTTFGTFEIEITDANCDGLINEVVIKEYGDDLIAINLSNGVEIWHTVDLGGYSSQFAIGDFDNDSCNEFAVNAQSNFHIVESNGSVTSWGNINGNNVRGDVATTDCNGDGIDDIVYTDMSAEVWCASVNSTNIWRKDYYLGDKVGVYDVDLDGDGVNEIITTNDGDTILILNSTGDIIQNISTIGHGAIGYFANYAPLSNGIAMGDLNGDLYDDMCVVGADGYVDCYYNNVSAAGGCSNDGACSTCAIGECGTNCSSAGCSISETPQLSYISGIGWQVNVTVPTFAEGLKDLFVNATWNSLVRWATEINAIDYGGAPADTCTYSSGNWAVTCGDNCTISSNVAGNANANFTAIGAGRFTMNANISGFKNYLFGSGCNGYCIGGCIKV